MLQDKVAIVSGAAQGIGEAIARLFVAEGANVVVADIKDEQGKAVTAAFKERGLFVHVDVTSTADWHRTVVPIVAAHGGGAIVNISSMDGTIFESIPFIRDSSTRRSPNKAPLEPSSVCSGPSRSNPFPVLERRKRSHVQYCSSLRTRHPIAPAPR
jgi:NAD(P)-dependent dehydrogenase (short-subunit alcohol dehydrogenase family)